MAADELEGRDNGTAGSLAAQQILIGQLAQFAQPADPTMVGDDGFRHVFPSGTNLLGVIPGGDLADEWVVLGAHYDHLGTDCRIDDPADSICNGATDNATGVAVALDAARAIAAAGTPRRSVLVALWDAEEDGLLGSAAYLQAPHAPRDADDRVPQLRQPGIEPAAVVRRQDRDGWCRNGRGGSRRRGDDCHGGIHASDRLAEPRVRTGTQ